MILILIILLILVAVETRKTRDKSSNYSYIRFDLRSEKQYRVLAILGITLGLVPICISLIFLENKLVDSASTLVDILFSLSVSVCPFITLLGLGAALKLFQCKQYFKRLKNNGYEIPKDVRDYDHTLTKVPRNEMVIIKEYPADSRINTIIAFVCFISLVGATIWYYVEWMPVEPDTAEVFMVCAFILDALWLLGAYFYYRQMDSERYKDATSPGDGRKNRKDVMDGVITILIMMLISIFCVSMAFSMTNYVHKSRIHAAQTEELR